jgi:hypothetical protein
MDVQEQRILIFGDSLSHHAGDRDPEIWDVDAPFDRSSSAPGDLLASLLLEQGAQAVRTDANVSRSASNFWRGNSRFQQHSANDLIASDREFAPTKVIIMLGTNDADSGSIDAASMQAIRDAYAGMGAEVWAIGPPIFASETLNAKVDQVYTMMGSIFGKRLIDARPLSSTESRAGDGIHFRPDSASALALQLANAVVSTASPRPKWAVVALGAGVLGLLGFMIWKGRKTPALDGPAMHMVDGKAWKRSHSPAAAGYKPIACKAGIPDLHCWASPAKLSGPQLDKRMARQSLKEERQAIDVYGKRIQKSGSKKLTKALRHARKEEREHAVAFAKLTS